MYNIITKIWQAPVGELILGSIGDKVCICDWNLEKRRAAVDRRICRALNARYMAGTSPTIERLIDELTQYFAGERRVFSLPLQFSGSEFQCRVWSALMHIPYGTTISYAELTHSIGNPKAVRAVASTIAMNPISIIVPCHRVIGSNHKLTGYAGGLDAKRALLTLETVQ